jgi:hypothetical protein
MSAVRQRQAERFLLEAVDANPRTAVPGSVRVDGFAMDWTEQTKAGPVARSSNIDRDALLELVAAAARTAPTTEEPTS